MTRDLGTEVLNQIFGHKIRALMSSTKSRNKLIYKSITLKDDSLRDSSTASTACCQQDIKLTRDVKCYKQSHVAYLYT